MHLSWTFFNYFSLCQHFLWKSNKISEDFADLEHVQVHPILILTHWLSSNDHDQWHIQSQFRFSLTWCKAVKPSILAVSMSAPLLINFSTSSLSEAAQAARKTHPSVNWILGSFLLGSVGSWLVLDSPQRFNCSALLKRAEEFRFSKEFICE